MKWLRRLLWFGLGLFLFLLAFSRGMAWYLGRDIEKLSVEVSQYKFEAQRDPESGVWKIHADTEESLWFAMGYVQTWDREFQLELMRLASRGELSRMLGEETLNNDRLMRFSKRLAENEWKNSTAQVKSAAQSFVDGHKSAKAHPDLKTPVEYEIMGLSRADFDEWEAQDVLALARFHSWHLSFDASLEALYTKIKNVMGAEKAKFLMPSEPAQSLALYNQEGLYEGVSKDLVLQKNKYSKLRLPKLELFYPEPNEHSSLDTHFSEKQSRVSSSNLNKSIFSKYNFDASSEWALRGASNLWIIADPRVGKNLTLCNDTHLRFSWPSTFYPIQFELKDKMKSAGVMLPGVPAVVIGSFEDLAQDHQGSLLSWGLTLASYTDSQDLVLIEEQQIQSSSLKTWESYGVKNLETGQIEVRRFQETWTPHGPRVDGIYAKIPSDDQKWVALDWVGFRNVSSPVEFFVNRNLKGGEGLVEDLHTKFSFPNFNFTWIEKPRNEDPKIGHLVTGWIRSRSQRSQSGLEMITPSQIQKTRNDSSPADRSFYYRKYDYKDPFFLVSANQRVWSEDDQSHNLTHAWEPQERSKRILARIDDIKRDPTFSQTDYFTPTLFSFFKHERTRNSVDRLCGGATSSSSQCVEWVSRLDAWNGNATLESWETSLIALWHAKFKSELFLALAPKEKTEEARILMSDWHRRSFSSQALHQMLIATKNQDAEKDWEKWSEQSLKSLSSNSFQWALDQFVSLRGQNPTLWRWGLLHRMNWFHPLARAPEPWGSFFQDSLLGPRANVGGAVDSPGRFEYEWDELRPLDFPATHGASLRKCTEFANSKDGTEIKMNWSFPGGPSGNPFSKHSKQWSVKTFFEGKTSPVH